jgi:hypothetical protein
MIGRPDKIEEFGYWLRDSPFSGILIIAGNHDILFQKKPEKAKKLLSKHDKIHYLEDSGCRINGISFYGTPWQPEFGYGWAFTINAEEELRKKWQEHTPRCTNSDHSWAACWNIGFYGRYKTRREYVTIGRDHPKNKTTIAYL